MSKFTSNEQKLVDCCFSFALMSVEYMKGKTHEEIATWVASNLFDLGFPTIPVGMSWGKLEEREDFITKHALFKTKRLSIAIEIIESGRPE